MWKESGSFNPISIVWNESEECVLMKYERMFVYSQFLSKIVPNCFCYSVFSYVKVPKEKLGKVVVESIEEEFDELAESRMGSSNKRKCGD